MAREERQAYDSRLNKLQRIMLRTGVDEDIANLTHSIMKYGKADKNAKGDGSHSYNGKECFTYEGRIKATDEILKQYREENPDSMFSRGKLSTVYKTIDKLINKNEYLATTQSKKKENQGIYRADAVKNLTYGLMNAAQAVEKEKELQSHAIDLERTKVESAFIEEVENLNEKNGQQASTITAIRTTLEKAEEELISSDKVVRQNETNYQIEREGTQEIIKAIDKENVTLRQNNTSLEGKIKGTKKNRNRLVVAGVVVGTMLGFGIGGCYMNARAEETPTVPTPIVAETNNTQNATNGLVKLTQEQYEAANPTDIPAERIEEVIKGLNQYAEELQTEPKNSVWDTTTEIEPAEVILPEETAEERSLLSKTGSAIASPFVWTHNDISKYVSSAQERSSADYATGKIRENSFNDNWDGVREELAKPNQVGYFGKTWNRVKNLPGNLGSVFTKTFRRDVGKDGQKENLINATLNVPTRAIASTLGFVGKAADIPTAGVVTKTTKIAMPIVGGAIETVGDSTSTVVAQILDHTVSPLEEMIYGNNFATKTINTTAQTLTRYASNTLRFEPTNQGNFTPDGEDKGLLGTATEQLPFYWSLLSGNSGNGGDNPNPNPVNKPVIGGGPTGQ